MRQNAAALTARSSLVVKTRSQKRACSNGFDPRGTSGDARYVWFRNIFYSPVTLMSCFAPAEAAAPSGQQQPLGMPFRGTAVRSVQCSDSFAAERASGGIRVSPFAAISPRSL